MGGNKDAKKQAEEDRRRADEERRRYEALLNTQLQTQQKVDPLEDRLKTGNMSFLDAVEGKGDDGVAKPFDIRDSRLGLAPNLALFDSAVNRQDDDRQGQGLLTMGQATSNPNLTALLSEQRKSRAAQDAGGGLERAFQLRNAEVRGSALPLIGVGQQRNATGLGAISNIYGGAADRYGQASGRYQQLASQPSFWERLLMSGVQGAAGAAAASDPRLKKDVAVLNGIHAVNFTWNENARAYGYEPNTKAVGLMADEVEAVLPQFVGRYNGIKGIDYMGLSAYLLEMVKEMSRTQGGN